jgi:hypothetical protein
VTIGDELLASVVADRRLSTTDARGRNRFTLARDEALLQLRGAEWSPHAAHPGARPWIWTLALLRAARVASAAPSVRVHASTDEEGPVLRLHVLLPESGLDALDLSGLVYAALEPDRSIGDTGARLRRLLGRAINGALATEPRWIELRSPVGSRRWERSVQATGGSGRRLDPYVERPIAERSDDGELEIVLAMPRAGWTRALGTLLSRSDPLDEIDRLWRRALLGTDPEESVRSGVSLVPRWPGEPVELGSLAKWIRVAEAEDVWLVRDGVLVASLSTTLAGRGLAPDALRGFVECAELGLTVDEGKVVDDEVFEALVAWLFDALAHTGPDGHVQWPSEDEPVALRTAAGVEVPIDALTDDRDVLFVWQHHASEIPAALQNRVLGLWPSQHRWLRQHCGGLRLVPLHALGRNAGARPADLTELVQASFSPVSVPVEPFVHAETRWAVGARAYVSRGGPPDQGTAIVLAYGRRVGFVTNPAEVIPGVSTVIELDASETSNLRIDVLQDDVEVLRRLVTHAIDAVRAHGDALLEAALDAVDFAGAWQVPYVRARATEASAWSLGLSYSDATGALALRWRDSPLLRLVVGETIDGRRRTLGDALVQARDVGGVVTTERTRRWKTLESDQERHRPWVLTDDGRGLLERVLGPEVSWAMPIVAEAQPHVAPIAQQPALRLDPEEIERLRPGVSTNPRARALLLAGTLAAISDGHAVPTLEELPLVRRYDPRAITARRLVSIASVRALATPPGLAPVGAVDRGLSAPVLEVPPALAALLAEVEGLRPAALEGARSKGGIVLSSVSTAVERRARREEPLVTVPVVDRIAAGALTLEREPTREGISLWARGLRVGTFRLPSPLRNVTGRLWLTDAGIVAGHTGIHALASSHGEELVRAAMAARLLTAPGSPRRGALEAFLSECRQAVAAGDDRAGIGSALMLRAGAPAPAMKRLPQPLGRGLSLVVRHALEQPAMIETTLLSRQAVRLSDPGGWPWRLRLGRRHPWIRQALRSDADVADVRMAACLVVAEAVRQAGAGTARLTHALLRLLAGAVRVRS